MSEKREEYITEPANAAGAERVLDDAQLMVYRDWAEDEDADKSVRNLIRLIVKCVDNLTAENAVLRRALTNCNNEHVVTANPWASGIDQVWIDEAQAELASEKEKAS